MNGAEASLTVEGDGTEAIVENLSSCKSIYNLKLFLSEKGTPLYDTNYYSVFQVILFLKDYGKCQ